LILIIGGTGFFGRRLTPLLANCGEEIARMDIDPLPRSTVDWDISQADDFRTRGEPWTTR